MATPIKVTETTLRGALSTSSRSADGTRKAKRTFIVEYDPEDRPAGPWEAETADDGTTAVPAVNSTLPGDTSRIASSVTAKPRDNTGLLFDVEVDYETDVNEIGDSPLTVPVDYDWDFSASSQPYFKDCSSTPKYTVTSAGEPLQNLLEREVGQIVVTITDNIADVGWDPVLAAQYMSEPATAKNDAPMTIDGLAIGAGQARMGGIRCSGIKTSNGIDYRTRTIILKLRKSWDDVIDDRGFHEKDSPEGSSAGFSGKLREIVKGVPPVKPDKPWPLDGAGAALPNAGDTPADLTFVPYPEKDFVVWGIS
jgi:hypothetical protein